MNSKKVLKKLLESISKSKLKKLQKLVEKKAKTEQKKKSDLYDIEPKTGRLTSILGDHISNMKIKDATNKLINWAGKDKKKQKSVRGMLTYIMNISDSEKEKSLIKKVNSILNKVNKEFERINEKDKKTK